MAGKVITVTPGDRAEGARQIMLERNISQLPVVDAKSLIPIHTEHEEYHKKCHDNVISVEADGSLAFD